MNFFPLGLKTFDLAIDISYHEVQFYRYKKRFFFNFIWFIKFCLGSYLISIFILTNAHLFAKNPIAKKYVSVHISRER
jgi:hypothetical protein